MKKLFIIILVLVQTVTLWADAPKYLIMFADGTEAVCYILNNDSISKRLNLQYENDVRRWWVSYYQIRSIVDAQSQKNVTGEFIQLSSMADSTVQKETEKSDGFFRNMMLITAAVIIIMLLGMGGSSAN